mmetsp:Transcript_5860/g.20874  ORF Transcript_5860/g.20874 Transcript_5860/m.20874 type:complete len:245 (+) Transcript_5860:2531-3265(+)
MEAVRRRHVAEADETVASVASFVDSFVGGKRAIAAEERLERRDERGAGVVRVATFESEDYWRVGERRREVAGEVRKVARLEAAAGERIGAQRVEARADEHEAPRPADLVNVRLCKVEAGAPRLGVVCEHCAALDGRGEAVASWAAVLSIVSGEGPQSRFVRRRVAGPRFTAQSGGVDVVRHAVAVVHVPVKHDAPVDARFEGVLAGGGGEVVDAKALRRRVAGVVARRPRQSPSDAAAARRIDG